MQKIAALVLFLFLFSYQMESVEPGPVESAACYDGCSTRCIEKYQQLSSSCDLKCQIRCAPGAMWVMIILCVVLAILLVVLFSCLCSSCCRRRSKLKRRD